MSKQVNNQANESKKTKTEKIPIESSENVEISVTDNETKPQKKPVTKNKKAEQAAVQNDNEKQKETAAISRKTEHTAPQNGKEEKKKAVTPSVSPHPEHTAAAAVLIAEGVTPARARSFAAIFEPEHIERNVALGLHRTKNNPPAYLLRLIQDDAASKRIVPGSGGRSGSATRTLRRIARTNRARKGPRSAGTRPERRFSRATQATRL